MMSSSNVKPTNFTPKTISEFLAQVSIISNVSDKLVKFDRFITRLEDEMRKLDAFKRELPLSVLLVNDAIVALKEELIRCRNTNAEPVFQEFLPSKESYNDGKMNDDSTRMEEESGDKKDWMSSVKLWNTTSDQTSQGAVHNCTTKPISMAEIAKRSEQELDAKMEYRHHPIKGRAEATTFFPFKVHSPFPVAAARKKAKVENKDKFPVAELSLVTSRTGKSRLEFGLGSSVMSSKLNIWTSSQKKQRRHWSPELHRQFVSALQQLGDSEVATANQIRELMQVDGLTNAEVNSHLQKYRLRKSRSSTSQSVESALTLNSALRISEDGEDSIKTCSKSTSPGRGSPLAD